MDINFRWNFTVKVELSPAVAAKLDAVLLGLKKLEGETMSVAKDLKDLAAKFDKATNDVAARIDRISNQIKNSMTDEEAQQIRDQLQAEVDRLTVLGQDPADPVPAPE